MHKISKRIIEIIGYIPKNTSELWDLCCDHGRIGEASLVHHSSITTLHFVDIVESIMTKLRIRIQSSDIPPGVNIFYHSKSAKDIKIQNPATLILAGIGGKQSIEILDEVINKCKKKSLDLDIVLSAHDNMFELREYLYRSQYYLVREKLICDNGHFYEILHLSTAAGIKISLIGEQMWLNPGSHHRVYLAREIAYLELKTSHVPDDKLKKRLTSLKKTLKSLN